ncbi:MAG: DUF4367 domain-containing protein [Ruminiclostridium sp.]|nr:DUF4367 domain-containing protein [Ruminiclostridium sp.]
MSEQLLYEVLAEAYNKEFADFDNAPRHRFSHSHKVKMRRLFAGYTAAPTTRPRIKLKYVWIAIILACLLVITGGVIMFFADGFKGIVHTDHIRLYVSDVEGSPETIEKSYFLSVLPEGFTLEHYTTGYSFNTFVYRNNEGKGIFFTQYVKNEFDPYVNNVGVEFTETTVNGYNAIYAEHSKDGFTDSIIFWDGGDYVFKLSGSGSKEYIKELAEKNEMAGLKGTE